MFKEIGDRIKTIRKSKNLTTDDVGEEIGMLGTSYSKIERGGNTTLDTLLKIAEVLEVNAKVFFDDHQKVSEKPEKFGYATKEELENQSRQMQSFFKKEFEKLREELLLKKASKKEYIKKKKTTRK